MKGGVKFRPRAAGKTFEMVQWIKADPENRAIIVIHERERERLMREYALTERQVVNFQRRQMTSGHPHRELAIDNADIMLQGMFPGSPVRLATFSNGSFEYSEHEPAPQLGKLSKVLVRFGL